MEHLQSGCEETYVSFDLNEIFNDSSVQMSEIDAEDIPR